MNAKILQALHEMKAQMHKALSLIKTMPCFVFFVGIQLDSLVLFGLELYSDPIEKLLAVSRLDHCTTPSQRVRGYRAECLQRKQSRASFL